MFVDVSSSRVCGFIIIELCSLMYHRVVLVDLSSLSGGGGIYHDRVLLVDLSSLSRVGGFIIMESCRWIYHRVASWGFIIIESSWWVFHLLY